MHSMISQAHEHTQVMSGISLTFHSELFFVGWDSVLLVEEIGVPGENQRLLLHTALVAIDNICKEKM